MFNEGHSYNAPASAEASVGRIKLWHEVTRIKPGGAYLAPSDEYPVGTEFPGGLPISTEKPGGTPTLNSATPDGLSRDDVVMGTDGCTFTIVTEGEIYAKRTRATITDAQKKHLFGRISFTNA